MSAAVKQSRLTNFSASLLSATALAAGLFAASPPAVAAEPSAQAEGSAAQAPAGQTAGDPARKDRSPDDETITRDQLSDAQKIIFDTPQLAGITSPTILKYRFERKGQFKDDFSDQVKLKVSNINPDGTRDVAFDFFTGNRRRTYPAIEHFHGNPLSMIYLQRDATELAKFTGGNVNFFRVSILYGFHDLAQVSDAEINGPNGTIKGQKVTLRPYEKAKRGPQLGPIERKTYEFIVSPEIPGQIYSIRTIVPPPEGAAVEAPNMVEETLTFDGVEPLANSGVTN